MQAEAMREKILRLVRTYPGLHLRALARQADTSLNLVQYHVQRLQHYGVVDISLDGGKVHVYPPDLRRDDRLALACLRDRKRLRIVLALLDEAPQSHGRLASALKLGKSTLSFHLRHLEDARLVVAASAGYTVGDPARVRTLLGKYPPTPDAADRLAELWRAVYGEP